MRDETQTLESPSNDDGFSFVELMFGSVISWTWVKGFMNLFFLAAFPFWISDLWSRKRDGRGKKKK